MPKHSADRARQMTGSQKGRRRRVLLMLALAELMAMAVWFSASAVVPALTLVWELDGAGQAWLTMSVQVGFVLGALGFAFLNLADRIPARRLFAVCALLGAFWTGLIPALQPAFSIAVLLRLLTGVCLAGVYPVGMKIMATWTRRRRGLGIGLLVGALTLGSGFPHLLKLFGESSDWQSVLYLAAATAAGGGLLTFLFVDEGPYRAQSPPFDWRYAGRILRQRDILLVNLGYLGHMWELYAMWTWVPVFLLESFAVRGVDPSWASAAGFAIIAVGGAGCLFAGWLADHVGRTVVIGGSLLVSGGCALLAGRLFGADPVVLTALCLVWGFAVVADSAQFSAAVSELCQPEYVGTALTLQTSLGFLLTMVTIRLVPLVVEHESWGLAFAILAFGPMAGIWAMGSLRRQPTARQLAGGRG